jgi:hypothetical protein
MRTFIKTNKTFYYFVNIYFIEISIKYIANISNFI